MRQLIERSILPWLARATVLVVLAAAVACGGSGTADAPGTAAAEAPPETVEPLAPGAPFPAGVWSNLNPTGPKSIDLATLLGTKPVVLYYWIAGNPRAEAVFREVEQHVANLGADKLTLLGVAVPRAGVADAPTIRERIRVLGLRSAVLQDDDFRIGQLLKIEHVPSISIIDKQGKLQLSNGSSLAQSLSPEVDLASLIRRAADTGELPTYGALGHYFPVRELEGQQCPDFRAPLLVDRVEQRWHSLLDDDKLNVLIFWSVDCPHCRRALPEINTWLRQNPGDVNVFSAAKVTDESTRTRTRQFCDVNGFVFPTLVDGGQVTSLYQVTTTPTILIIRPDGVIDSAIISTSASFGETIEKKMRELLRTS